MPRIPIAYIDISFFAHATEDSDKVLEAARKVIPPEYAGEVTFKKSNLKGDYGNPIIFHAAKIKEDETIEALIRHISSNLTALDRETLSQEFELRLDNGIFYLRLDKQAALKGSIKLCRADPIHIRIRFKTRKTEEIADICKELRMLP